MKPYIFWIVIAVVCVVVLAVGYVLEPTVDGKTVQDLTEELDDAYDDLTELSDRARNQIPSYPTNDPDYFKKLQKETLVTKKWIRGGLSALQADYKQQQEQIRADLVRRGAALDDPISNERDEGQWYFEYQDVTGAWLKQLQADGLVTLQTGRFSTGKASFTDDELKNRNDLRSPYGLFTNTSTDDYPSTGMWASLTVQFRLLQQIAGCIRQARVTPRVNPGLSYTIGEGEKAKQVRVVPAPESSGVRLLNVSWEGGVGDGMVMATVPGGTAISCTVRVRGTPAAILSLCAIFDAKVEPMVVMRGINWKRPGDAVQAEANAADTDFEADIHLSFLRFSEEALKAIGAKEEG